MDIRYPDIAEYRFILDALCGNIFPSFPRFRCEAVASLSEGLEADISFVPAPLAVAKSESHLILSSGSIFSYFSGPIIVAPREEYTELYVPRDDFYSVFFARVFMPGISIKEGDDYPSLLEPRLAILRSPFPYPKIDLYSSWASVASNLPIPIYCGIIRKEMEEAKRIAEDAIRASVKYALNNSDLLIKEIAHIHDVKNVDLLKRVVLNFVNKNTLSMAQEEVEAIQALKRAMDEKHVVLDDLSPL
jgi:hypothetical protein